MPKKTVKCEIKQLSVVIKTIKCGDKDKLNEATPKNRTLK